MAFQGQDEAWFHTSILTSSCKSSLTKGSAKSTLLYTTLIDIENEDLKADVEAIKAMQEELEKRNSKFVQSPRADDEAEETKEEVKGGDQEGQQEEGAKKEKKFYV